ncbi:MAG: 23S rRNA (adenine(2503)-C(2))-methyltransferase RlmN [candidate division SR1 bacterium]|nr:23S rRNA (adenine(2503)-C(2))-methyltransferase RlmN [candidate division SR1 bacterium]
MNPSILSEDSFQAYAKEHKLQPFRVKQVFYEIYKNQNIEFSEMTTLSKELRQDLDEKFCVIPFSVTNVLEDENTTKIGLQTTDGHLIEVVILYHWDTHELHEGNKGAKENKGGKDFLSNHSDLSSLSNPNENKLNRITLCISSQVGCPMNCLFCVTGKLGLKRNLTVEEIIGQVLYANNYIKNKFGKKDDGTLYGVRNVVFMGMGEPLLNYDNMKKAIELMLPQERLSLSRRHITISTAGIIPGIRKLIEDNIPVKLAISLHAPNQELRNQLMPIAKKYPLDELMKTIDDYVQATDNRIFYEYIMIKGVTDKPELAKELAKLLRGRLAHVNLIAYNMNPAIDLEESSKTQMYKFKEILENEGITVTVRASMGREGKGACGQLGYEKVNEKS